MNKGLICAAVLLLGLTACTSENNAAPQAQAAAPEAFGPAGYRGLTPGMSREAALATGKLAAEPTSKLDGCTDFGYTGGRAPDPARMAAEDAAQKKAEDLHRKSEEAEKTLGTSAAESAQAAQIHADAALAAAELAEKREARDVAFAAEGGASFGKDGLRELGAPATAKTAEGIGAGSTVDELTKAYEARGLKLGENKRYQLELTDKPGWRYEFTTTTDNKVGAVSLISSAKCA